MWPDRRIIDLFKTEFPIVLAPMAGIMDAELAIAAAQGGALGSLPCAMLSVGTAIAQGAEAGGHRGMFLTDNIAEQPGTFALVPQVVDAVKVPVIAAGGIADGRGIAAAFALGASGVQIGSAYLRCPESKVIASARIALAQAHDDSTVITNVMTGRPARGVANRVMREVGPDRKRV